MKIKYENVTFLTEPAKKLSKEEFIALHLEVFWRDKSEKTRAKMLGAVHDLITGVKKSKKK